MACLHMNNSSISVVKIRFTTFAVDIDCICFEKGKEKTILQLKISGLILKILAYLWTLSTNHDKKFISSLSSMEIIGSNLTLEESLWPQKREIFPTALFKNRWILKLKSHLKFLFFAAVNHHYRLLRKQKFSSVSSKVKGLWFVEFDPFC